MPEEDLNYSEISETEFDTLLSTITRLGENKKQKLAQKLLGGEASPFTVIIGGNNVINNNTAILVNGSVEDLAKQLSSLDIDTVSKLLEAIAIYMKNP